MNVPHFVVGTDYRINFILDEDIAGAQSVQIGYMKPSSGTTAYWTAVVDDEATGAGHYDVTAAQNDTAGEWHVWPKVVRADGKVLEATAQVIQIVAEGQVFATP